MFVVNIVTIRGAMESEIFFVEVDGVLTSGYCQVDVDQCGDWVSSELANFCLFDDGFIKRLSVRLFLFLVLFVLGFFLFLLVLHTVLVFGLIDVEPDLAHTVVITELFGGGFDDDVIFIDCDIFHIVEGNPEHLVVPHWQKLQFFWS